MAIAVQIRRGQSAEMDSSTLLEILFVHVQVRRYIATCGRGISRLFEKERKIACRHKIHRKIGWPCIFLRHRCTAILWTQHIL